MGVLGRLHTAFYQGTSSTSSLVPFVYDVALNGRPYMIDRKAGTFSVRSIPVQRQQSDDGLEPGSQTLNREEMWRRSFQSWHLGAGQEWRDTDEDPSPYRYRSSKGVDPWTRFALSLLPGTERARASAQTNLKVIAASTRAYLTDNLTIYESATGASWSSIGAPSANAITGITYDGEFVYVADGADVYRFADAAAGPGAAWNTLNAQLLWFGLGRLMATSGASIYNIISAAAPAALWTHPNSTFTWVGFAAGQTAIYAAGNAGTRGAIYRLPILADGTSLDSPLPAGDLPVGETITAIFSYLGFLCIGTSRGFRLAAMGTELTIGPLIETAQVECFDAWGQYVWFGWKNYDSTSTGLGRFDLSQFTSPLVPAYASDLMATAQGSVLGTVDYSGSRIFAVSGSGVWREDDDLVTSGTIDTGFITYGIPDKKVLDSVELRFEPLAGEIAVDVSTEWDTFDVAGQATDLLAQQAVITTAESQSDRHELRLTLTRSEIVTTTGPTLHNTTLLALPVPVRGEVWIVPLIISERLDTHGGGWAPQNPLEEFFAAVQLIDGDQVLVLFQCFGETFRVYVEDYQFDLSKEITNSGMWDGTLTLRLKVPAQRETA